MSVDDAQQIMDMWDKWDSRDRRRNFIARMEHKLRSKEDRRSQSRH